MSIYSKAGGIRPGKSAHNLSYEVKMTADMGKLYPVMFKECIPGDTFKIGNEIVIRFQPLVAPVLSEINAFVHYFFVPTRLLMDTQQDWNDFITGGIDGEAAVSLPRWTVHDGNNAKGTLWDYFGLPVGVTPKKLPLAFPKRCMNLVWNEYYRDENLQDEVDIDNDLILNRAWKKDYFTSALPWQQRGVSPSFPIAGTANAVWSGDLRLAQITTLGATVPRGGSYFDVSDDYNIKLANTDLTNMNYGQVGVAKSTLNQNEININGLVGGFDVSDLRLGFQIQKWMERNARAGVRYTEFLRAHFGTAPRDEVLQRPQYIGGSKSPVMISEVLQTSATDSTSAQGNLAGHGLTADRNFCCTYKAKEFGYIIGIMSVMPKAQYQQGVDRALLRETRYDFYFPEFANLSEQAVENEELYADGTNADTEIFGYQGRYNELRSSRSLVVGDMRDTFDYWHLGRKFDSRPNLNSTFIECNPSKRIFAVQDEPGMVVNVGNIIKAYRPIPAVSEPGFIDHN